MSDPRSHLTLSASLEEFNKALSECKIEKNEIPTGQYTEETEREVGIDGYDTGQIKTVRIPVTRIEYKGSPVSIEEFELIYANLLKSGATDKIAALEKFLLSHDFPELVAQVEQRAVHSLMNQIKEEIDNGMNVQQPLNALKDFCEKKQYNPPRLEAIIAEAQPENLLQFTREPTLNNLAFAIENLREDKENKDFSSEKATALPALENHLAHLIKNHLIEIATKYKDTSGGWLQRKMTGHGNAKVKALDLIKQARTINTLEDAHDVIKDVIDPKGFGDDSLNTILLMAITGDKNRNAYALVLDIDKEAMPAFNPNHTKKTRRQDLNTLGLLKSDDDIVKQVTIHTLRGSDSK